MPTPTRITLPLILALALSCPAAAFGADKPAGAKTPAATAKPGAATPDPAREKLEKEFAAKLTGAVLVGHFTVEGEDKPPAEERYEINKVSKLTGDMWLFTARVKFGDKDVTVPMPLPVKWAGDTPVISVTKTTIPGLGTYTARVLFYGDHYAGTWSGGDHGGHLWGRIERKDAAGGAGDDKSEEKEPKAQPEDAEGAGTTGGVDGAGEGDEGAGN